jgi:DNA helicase-2/ATP-dependent DNA helicase PcrA
MPLSNLNAEQYQAATAPYGHNLIIASAGTGKTSTIVARIGSLLQSDVKPDHILLLTFTNKAAAEMIERVANKFGTEVAEKIESGTFHAVSYRLLKRIGHKIVLKQPAELKTLLKTIYEKRNFSYIDHTTPAYQSNYLFDFFSLYENSAYDQKLYTFLEERAPEHEPYFDIYEDIYIEFKELKENYGYVGFNDLLILMKETLYRDKEAVYFKEVLVDEYQDTNTLQGLLIDAFRSPSLFCVGDFDQSIYAFNGANINIIGSFKERYQDAHIHMLSRNYRSTKHILDLANRVIAHNPRLYDKELVVTRDTEASQPKLLVYSELFEQYKGIANTIKNSFTTHSDIAVIFRNNSSADGIEASLREFGIGCKRKGGTSLFETKEIKAALDILTLIVNPKDMMAFIHLFEYVKGVGAVLSKEVFDILIKAGGNVVEGFLHPSDVTDIVPKKQVSRQLALFGDTLEVGSVTRFSGLGFDELFLSNPLLKHPKLSSDAALFLYELYQLIKKISHMKNPHNILMHIFNSKTYGTITQTIASKRATLKDGTVDTSLQEEAIERIKRKNLLIVGLAKNYHDCERFLNALTLGANEVSEGEGVNLLSIHASKGLEYKEVYIIDLMDGRFPNRKLMQKGGSLDEERRLFYVAATRAKDILYLSYAKYDKIKKIDYISSPFLSEAGLIASP